MRQSYLLFGGLALVAYVLAKKSSPLPSGVKPVIGAGGAFVITGGTDYAGIPPGTLTAYKLPNGNVLDPRGIPLGAKLSDGTTWHGVEVATVQPASRDDTY